MRRLLACILLCSLVGSANADPLLLLLLRMLRDHAISKSVESGVGSIREQGAAAAPSLALSYALPTDPLPQANEASTLRALINESFLHLDRAQRDAVYASLRKVLDDPSNALQKSWIVAEFTLKAQEVRNSYRSLEQLPESERRALVAQAKAGYQSLGSSERSELLDVLKSRMLPIPRDFNDTILAELSSMPLAAAVERSTR